MKKTTLKGAVAALALTAVAAAGQAVAGPDEDELVIDGETIVTRVAAPEDHPLDELISGWRFRSDETQALQMDDFENPAMVLVDQARDLWAEVDGSEGKACESCHMDVEETMVGVRAGYPKWNEAAGKPFSLEHAINACRTERMGAEAWKWESDQMLGMTALVGLQSRGMPVDIDDDALSDWIEQGKELYYTRVGQLDMSCAHCHEDNYGNMIRADHLSQGHVNGFPVYRLKWQKVGSMHRRFKGCMDNIRAEPYKRGSDEFVALEAYLAWRGQGLSVETPAVRN
ncbi:sulfur oxidation c-type cytochrome SoxA [Rhodovulum sp. DZ06]|uniref:sulfur oxidation c-type cytochrome SoxA n=1 Tax=Rhodovulum sp. DZ06 TaxID=3425126 RepID=UPI003D345BFA